MTRPSVFTIPAHRAFADALVTGLMRRAGDDPMALARGLVVLPNNRARRAIGDAFVRASGGALLLPRMVALGDADLDEAMGAALDPADAADPPSPAIAPLARQLALARLVEEARADAGRPVDAAEAVRLADALARTLDQLIVEEIAPARLRDVDVGALSDHWQAALALFDVVIDRWPDEMARRGMIDPAARRILLLDRLAMRWRAAPPAGFVCAAGITDTAPAVARVLRTIADLPQGMVVLAGLDEAMPEEEWASLGPHDGGRPRAIEVHPQFHLKLLLDRMGVARGEVARWRGGTDYDAGAARGRAIANALAPAEATAKWTALDADQRRLAGVTAAELATPAEEAQAIALALRATLEEPGRTAALVTPDRALARRVAAHCRRWNIELDDSAGRPLSIMPPGTLLLAIAEAAAQDFAPLALLTLLKHPLVCGGETRLAWLDGVRMLDRALRGPRPAPGLGGIEAHLASERAHAGALAWWPTARDRLAPLAAGLGGGDPARTIACLRAAATALAGDAAWSGPAGRAAADLLAGIEEAADDGPRDVPLATLAPLLRTLMDAVAVRLPPRGHPRLAIYGLIEARLQSADVMVLGGLNEGTWPASPAPDPWLAPRIRAELGLPGLDRRIGIAAHDFGQALGAPRAIITRSRRDGRSPALASRFWLRLEALAGERFARAGELEGWARMLDAPRDFAPADRPEPRVPAIHRPLDISVTEVDRLKADPYAFYARRILRLAALDPVDADPSPAWRGNAVHAVLQDWWEEDRCAPDALLPRARAMLDDPTLHPLLRALWQPRLVAGLAAVAARTAREADGGRAVIAAEGKGEAAIAGVTLRGRFDRIDALPGGGIAIIDYKTGQPPSPAAVREGFSLQLGLLGAIAERGGFAPIAGPARGFEYWSLAKGREGFGSVSSPADPAGARSKVPTDDFVAYAVRHFTEAAARWLTGDEPFTAKLHPDYAPYAEYDQLMRRDEWYGRDA